MHGQGRLSRRALLGAGAGLAATAALGTRGTSAAEAPAVAAPSPLCSLLPPERIGLQLYSLRDAVAEQGFAPVLETVARIGFRQVEFAGYTQGTSPEITLQELRGLLDANGLVAAGSHVSPSDDASMQAILDEAEALGIPQVGISLLTPAGAPTVSGWRDAAVQFNHYGELASKRGIGFYLHNHFQEWLPTPDDPGRRGMDVLLAETDPRFVFFEFDIFWAYVGAAQSGGAFDPLGDYAIPQRERFKLFHVKDGRPERAEILDVGEGSIDFQTFFTTLFALAPGEVDRHLYLWERDSASDHPRGPLAAARSSFVNMRYGLEAAAGDCTGGFTAVIAGVRVRRGEGGRRHVRVRLDLGAGAEITATLTRDGRELASIRRELRAGRRTVDLRVPRVTAHGPARLEVAVTGPGGVSLVLRETVRIPRRRRS